MRRFGWHFYNGQIHIVSVGVIQQHQQVVNCVFVDSVRIVIGNGCVVER